jgi:hypothetical protein
MPVSPDTLLRLARRESSTARPTPRVVGVNDVALRKGQAYGTILVDLERHQPVDLLPERSADAFAQWLRDHPGVEFISRDRGVEYSWDLCEQCCTNLWVRTPFARDQALVWSERAEEFVKRAGFVLMVQVAGKDKKTPIELLHRYLARAEHEAHDERNFVKKAVNWAIRAIGQRSTELNEAAITVAQRLKESESRTARWVGSDALRELTSSKIAQRVSRREGRSVEDPLS